jgi:hypothetical protein
MVEHAKVTPELVRLFDQRRFRDWIISRHAYQPEACPIGASIQPDNEKKTNEEG